jgi:hypothetical protein
LLRNIVVIVTPEPFVARNISGLWRLLKSRIVRARSLSIELRETEIDALIRAGLLEEQSRDDSNAVVGALYGLLDRVFDSMTRNVARTW